MGAKVLDQSLAPEVVIELLHGKVNHGILICEFTLFRELVLESVLDLTYQGSGLMVHFLVPSSSSGSCVSLVLAVGGPFLPLRTGRSLASSDLVNPVAFQGR